MRGDITPLRRPVAAITLLAICFTAAPARAEDCLAVVAERVSFGKALTVTLRDGSIVAGQFSGVANEGLFVRSQSIDSTGTERRELRREMIAEIRYSDRTRPAVLWAVAGAALGGVAGGLLADEASDASGGDDNWIPRKTIGVGLGILLGGILGSMLPIHFTYNRVVTCAAAR